MAIHLSEKKCVACEGGTPPFTPEQVRQYTEELNAPSWDVLENNETHVNPGKIRKSFEFKDFKEAMSFVNKVADIANEEGHHPDIYIFYNKVRLELWTHAVKGLSENDFIMAAKIEKLLNA